MCKDEYLITKVWKWVRKTRRIPLLIIIVLLLIYTIFLFCNNELNKSLFLPTDIRTEINGDYYLEKELNQKEEIIESVETTEDKTTISRNFELIFLLGTLIVSLTALTIADTNLKQHKKLTETQILIELINEWNSEKMQAARASLSLKYLMTIKIGDNDFKDFKKFIKESLKKSELNKKYEEHIRSILKISSNQDAESRLTHLTPQEEDVLRFFEKVGLLLSDNDLNRDEVWESFITKMEPYFYAIGKPFIDKKRKYTKGYYHHYYYLIDQLCSVHEYTKKRETYKDRDSEENSTFYSFLNMDEPKRSKRTKFLAFSEIRYLTGENIRESYNK